MPISIRAAQNGDTATDAAFAQVGETVDVVSEKGTLAVRMISSRNCKSSPG